MALTFTNPSIGVGKIQLEGSDRLEINTDGIAVDGNMTSNKITMDGGAISPSTGMRNRIINGAMEIAQRGTSAQYDKNSGDDPVLSVDRMFSDVNTSDAVFTQSQETLVFEGVEKKCIRQTIDTPFVFGQPDGTAYIYGISQYLEGNNTHDLKGKAVTLSFIFNTNVSGRYSIYLRDAAGGPERNSFVSTFDAVANTPIKVTTTTNEIPLTANIQNNNEVGMSVGVGFIGSTSGVTTDTGSWISGNKLTTPDSTNWASQAGNFIELTELQLEEGTQATPFERRPFGVEFMLCQRYFQLVDAFRFATINGTFRGTGSSAVSSKVFLPVPMRGIPTCLNPRTTDFMNQWTALGTSSRTQFTATYRVSSDGVTYSFTTNTPTGNNVLYLLADYDAAASGYQFQLDDEL